MIRYFFKKTAVIMLLTGMAACRADVADITDADKSSLKAAAASSASETVSQIYFEQNFDSSANYLSYIGTGANQFDGLTFNGTSSINTLNNTLQIVKNGGTGTGNRAGATKTNTPFNPNAVGGFIKFKMKVTVSNNTPGVNVANGFLFSVGAGMTGTHADDPNVALIHSRMYISPAATAGAFVIKAGSTATPVVVSEALSGTQNLVWYINNSGTAVGYSSPDGNQMSILDDAADIWAIDGAGNARLVIDDVPASAPSVVGLRQLKISNNDNFVATLDIDDIVISEEPVITLKKITGISSVDPVTAPIKTIFSLLPLPALVDVTLEDGAPDRAAVRWSEITPYNPYKLGEYEVKGTIVANSGTINLDGLSISTKVTLRSELIISNAFSPNGDGINDTWIISDLKCYKTTSVEVFDSDGARLFYSTDPAVGWDGKNKKGKVIAGSYYYIIKVPDLLLEKKGVVTVIK